MATHRQRPEGRRCSSAECDREQIACVARKEISVAELSRELATGQSIIWRRKH